jgi:signal transduction histidine kinase
MLMGMKMSNEAIPRIILGLPLGFLVTAIGMFLVRWFRIRDRDAGESDALLLGAVSQSLQERGQLAASLGELRTVHERLLDALPFGILWVDQRQRVAAFNAPGRSLLGVKPGVIGLDAAFILEPFPWLLEGLGKAPGPPWRCDGGGRRWQLQRIEAPDKIGLLLQFEDITEREQGERRRQMRDRFADLGEMTAGVAHQFKNSLAVLKGHGQLLARAGQGEAGAAILEETDALERLVQRFLLWAKPLEPQCVELELAEVAGQALAEMRRRPAFQDRQLRLEGQGTALADPMMLHQALVNLLENACQATPAGSLVRVLAGPGVVEILDQGPGLNPEALERMLRPFESGRPDGTGLGLPLALKWLNAQGADLEISAPEGGGTRVRVCWQ